eukprot:5903384-Prymnesium_polylepis.1
MWAGVRARAKSLCGRRPPGGRAAIWRFASAFVVQKVRPSDASAWPPPLSDTRHATQCEFAREENSKG